MALLLIINQQILGRYLPSEGSNTEFYHAVIYGNQAAEVGGGVNTVGAGIGAAFDSNVNFTYCSLADNITLSGGVGGFLEQIQP